MGVTGDNDACNEAGGVEGGHAEGIDATKENAGDYNDKHDTQQQRDQRNGDCDNGFHQEVNNRVHHEINHTGDEARGGGEGKIKETIPLGKEIVQMSTIMQIKHQKKMSALIMLSIHKVHVRT